MFSGNTNKKIQLMKTISSGYGRFVQFTDTQGTWITSGIDEINIFEKDKLKESFSVPGYLNGDIILSNDSIYLPSDLVLLKTGNIEHLNNIQTEVVKAANIDPAYANKYLIENLFISHKYSKKVVMLKKIRSRKLETIDDKNMPEFIFAGLNLRNTNASILLTSNNQIRFGTINNSEYFGVISDTLRIWNWQFNEISIDKKYHSADIATFHFSKNSCTIAFRNGKCIIYQIDTKNEEMICDSVAIIQNVLSFDSYLFTGDNNNLFQIRLEGNCIFEKQYNSKIEGIYKDPHQNRFFVCIADRRIDIYEF